MSNVKAGIQKQINDLKASIGAEKKRFRESIESRLLALEKAYALERLEGVEKRVAELEANNKKMNFLYGQCSTCGKPKGDGHNWLKCKPSDVKTEQPLEDCELEIEVVHIINKCVINGWNTAYPKDIIKLIRSNQPKDTITISREVADKLNEFIRRITLDIQSIEGKSQEQRTRMFHEAYALYSSLDVENKVLGVQIN